MEVDYVSLFWVKEMRENWFSFSCGVILILSVIVGEKSSERSEREIWHEFAEVFRFLREFGEVNGVFIMFGLCWCEHLSG